MRRDNFYRRDPGAALAGMAGMSLEERGVYNTVIDLLYLTWRPLEFNPAYIAGHCGCAVQKVNPILARLIERGKLVRFDEGGQTYLSNPTFEDERAAVKGEQKTRSGRRDPAQKSAGVGEKSAGIEKNPPTTQDETPENQPVKPLEKSRVEEKEGSVPNGTGGQPPPPDELEPLRGLEANKRAWDGLLLVLTKRGNLTEAKARSLIGRLRQAHGLGPAEMWAMAEDAWRNGTHDPVPYLEALGKAIRRRRGAPTAPAEIDRPSERQQAAWVADWLERGRPGWKRHERGPCPGEQGCRVDPDILRRHGVEPWSEPDGEVI